MKQDFSKSQGRAARLLGLSFDVNDSYGTLGDRLADAGVSRDGIPGGETWRTAAKLSDAALLAALTRIDRADYSGSRDSLQW